jgi:hypothetical protein
MLHSKLGTLTSNEHDTEPKCFNIRSQIANYKMSKTYEGALFCTQVQTNEVMYVQVQLLLSLCCLCTSPLHKQDATFGLLSVDLRYSPRQ